MKQLYSKDVWMTFESNGIPPLIQFLVCEVYLPPGNLLLHTGSIWREHLLVSLIPKLNEEGKRIYKDVSILEEAYKTVQDTEKEFRALCARILETQVVSEKDIDALLTLTSAFCAPYRYFDTWFSDGAYENRNDPNTAEALTFAGDTKNIIRVSLYELFFDPEGEFQKVIAHVAKLHGTTLEEVMWYLPDEARALTHGKLVPPETLAERRQAYVHYIDVDGTSTFLQGAPAEAYIQVFDSDRESAAGRTLLTGVVAHGSGAVIRGKVRIIIADYIDFSNTVHAMDAMEEGEVMVSTTTAPDVFPAMKKASAIITDLGGMLSHAAITARELNTPCIVGTREASKVLNDGDLVEVDAKEGTVRILEHM